MTNLETGAAVKEGPPAEGVAPASTAPRQARIPHGALRVMRATSANTAQIEAWAAAEGWNPGRGDSGLFLRTDPAGHFAGFLGERHVSSISVINYSDGFAFCGMLLVDPEMRHRGIGAATWAAAIGHAGERTVAADAPPHLIPQAEQLGFTDGFRILRYAGQIPAARPKDPHVVPLNAEEHAAALAQLDAACFPARRPGFAAAFATAQGHQTMVYTDANGNIRGYGVLRPARGAARIGPLYAERSYQAANIFDALCALAAQSGALKVAMDVPARSLGGRAIADTRGLIRRGEAHRIYRPGACELSPVDFEQLCALPCIGLG